MIFSFFTEVGQLSAYDLHFTEQFSTLSQYNALVKPSC